MELKPGCKQVEKDAIPDKWCWVELSELTKEEAPICYGIVQLGRNVQNGVQVLAIKNLNTDYEAGVHRSSEEIENKYIRSRVSPGDVIVSVKGTTGRIGIVPGNFFGNISRDLARIRLTDDNIPEYFFQLLQSSSAQRSLLIATVGTTRSELSINILKKVKVIVPPKEEQRAIAAVLSDVDALLASLEKLIAKKRDLKQAAMQQLLTGKTRLSGFSGEWEVKKLGDVAILRMDRVDPRRAGRQEFCVELEHIAQGVGRLVGSCSTNEDSSFKSVFNAGDVLFGKLRAYLRKYWLADRCGVCSTEIWVLVANRRAISPGYLYQLVTTDEFIDKASTAYGTHMPRSDWNIVKNYELALPKPNEQASIVAVLSDMDTEITALEAHRDKTHDLKQGMMQELLTGKTRLV